MWETELVKEETMMMMLIGFSFHLFLNAWKWIHNRRQLWYSLDRWLQQQLLRNLIYIKELHLKSFSCLVPLLNGSYLDSWPIPCSFQCGSGTTIHSYFFFLSFIYYRKENSLIHFLVSFFELKRHFNLSNPFSTSCSNSFSLMTSLKLKSLLTTAIQQRRHSWFQLLMLFWCNFGSGGGKLELVWSVSRINIQYTTSVQPSFIPSKLILECSTRGYARCNQDGKFNEETNFSRQTPVFVSSYIHPLYLPSS